MTGSDAANVQFLKSSNIPSMIDQAVIEMLKIRPNNPAEWLAQNLQDTPLSLTKVLGQGFFSAVYLGTFGDKQVAVKPINKFGHGPVPWAQGTEAVPTEHPTGITGRAQIAAEMTWEDEVACLQKAAERCPKHIVELVTVKPLTALPADAMQKEAEAVQAQQGGFIKMCQDAIASHPPNRSAMVAHMFQNAAAFAHLGASGLMVLGLAEHGAMSGISRKFTVGQMAAALRVSENVDDSMKLRAAFVAKMTSQLAEAVQACHQSGFLHMDVHLDNALLDGDYNVRLGDFGTARDISAHPANVRQEAERRGFNFRLEDMLRWVVWDDEALAIAIERLWDPTVRDRTFPGIGYPPTQMGRSLLGWHARDGDSEAANPAAPVPGTPLPAALASVVQGLKQGLRDAGVAEGEDMMAALDGTTEAWKSPVDGAAIEAFMTKHLAAVQGRVSAALAALRTAAAELLKEATPAMPVKDAPVHQGPCVSSMLRRAAQQYPKQVATVDGATGRTRTYAETADRVARLAGGLRSKGLATGGRVAIIMFNSDRFYELFYGCSWAGGCCVPINIRLAPPEMVAIVQDSGATHVVVDDTFAKPVIPAFNAAGLKVKFIFAGEGECPEGAVKYEDLVAQNDPAEDAGRGGSDVFGVFYTGGTTGKAKGVMLTHGNIFANASGQGSDVKWGLDTKYLHSAPMFHLADGAATFGVTLRNGTHVFMPRFDPRGMVAAIAEHKITHAMMVPVMMTMMLAVPDISTFDVSSLELVVYGASPMASSLLCRMLETFSNAKFMQGYGMTETSPAISHLAVEYHVKDGEKLGSVGRPVPWAEVRVVDENDKEVPRGTVGEIVTRGPHVMKGYWGLPEQSAAALRGGWMHTGDGGKMDEDGFLWLVDRIKDMIISGGENVYSAEVENCVMSFEPVAQCAVIGTPDEKLGELVTAVIVPKPGRADEVTADALKAFCKERIAGYKCPRKVVVRESLPVSGAGKILKHEVRKEFWSGHELSRTYGKDSGKSQYS